MCQDQKDFTFIELLIVLEIEPSTSRVLSKYVTVKLHWAKMNIFMCIAIIISVCSITYVSIVAPRNHLPGSNNNKNTDTRGGPSHI